MKENFKLLRAFLGPESFDLCAFASFAPSFYFPEDIALKEGSHFSLNVNYAFQSQYQRGPFDSEYRQLSHINCKKSSQFYKL